MEHWDEKLKNQVKMFMNGYNIFFTGVNKNSGVSTTRIKKLQTYDFVFGYCKDYELFIVWNGYLHINAEAVSIVNYKIKSYSDISFEYGYYNHNRKLGEKKVLIPKHRLEVFCNNCIEYLMPNPDDKGFRKSIWKWKNSEESDNISDSTEYKSFRARKLTEIYERDPAFRTKVLANYEYKCAICRCSIESVLEAHHIDLVSKNGGDDLSNGICLCRNHHKMVHSDLIKLNLEDNTYDVDDIVMTDVLTKWAIDNFNKKLIVPISRRK